MFPVKAVACSQWFPVRALTVLTAYISVASHRNSDYGDVYAVAALLVEIVTIAIMFS